jgi:hypothetical protein
MKFCGSFQNTKSIFIRLQLTILFERRKEGEGLQRNAQKKAHEELLEETWRLRRALSALKRKSKMKP